MAGIPGLSQPWARRLLTVGHGSDGSEPAKLCWLLSHLAGLLLFVVVCLVLIVCFLYYCSCCFIGCWSFEFVFLKLSYRVELFVVCCLCCFFLLLCFMVCLFVGVCLLLLLLFSFF